MEDRYSQIFTLDRVRPAQVADGLAELQVRWPTIPIVFCETRKLAQEWTYRYLAAAHRWAEAELPALARIGAGPTTPRAPRRNPHRDRRSPRLGPRDGLTVPDRGRLRPEIHQAWQDAH